MTGNAFQKFGDSMNHAITRLSVKTSSSLEKSKIKMHIESLTKEVQKMFMDIGEEVYAQWLNGEISVEPMMGKLEVIAQKKNEMEQLSRELEAIDDRDNEILGTKVEIKQKSEDVIFQKTSCPNCGSERDPAAKFCRRCGYKLDNLL